MSDHISLSTGIPLPTFDGRSEKYDEFRMQFRAYAYVRKFDKALTQDADLPATESAAATDEQKAAVLRNGMAVSFYTLAFREDSLKFLIIESITTDWPNGLAHVITTKLHKKYHPSDMFGEVEMEQALLAVHLGESEDPRLLFSRLYQVKAKFCLSPGATITLSDARVVSSVLSKSPAKYTTLLTTEMRRLEADPNLSVTPDALQEAMVLQWRTETNQDKANGVEGTTDLALNSIGGAKKKKSRKKKNKKDYKYQGTCESCGTFGHHEKDCWDKPENAHKRPKGYKTQAEKAAGRAGSETGATTSDIILIGGQFHQLKFPSHVDLLKDPNFFVGDTGASTHSTSSMDGATNIREPTPDEGISMGNRQTSKVSKIVDLKCQVCDQHGHALSSVLLTDVSITEGEGYNMFSIPRLQLNGWKLYGDDKKIELTKGNDKLVFDIFVPTHRGGVFGIYLSRGGTEVGQALVEKPKIMDPREAHVKFGHCGERATRAAAKAAGVTIRPGPMPVCEACASAKAKQKNLPRHDGDNEDDKKVPEGKRMIYLDISSVGLKAGDKRPSKPHWLVMVDAETEQKWSRFYKTKNEMAADVCKFLKRLERLGKKVDIIRLDNAGENKLLEKLSDSAEWQLALQFQFTAARTPQQNFLVEISIATLANRGRALMIAAHVPETVRYLLYNEAFMTATLLDGLIPIEVRGVTQTKFEHFWGELPAFANHLRTWGEAGTIKLVTERTTKVMDRGIQCMFVGYAQNHPGDCYRMFDPNTKRIHETRDVIWLRRMFFTPKPSVEVATGRALAPAPAVQVEEEILLPDDANDTTTGTQQTNVPPVPPEAPEAPEDDEPVDTTNVPEEDATEQVQVVTRSGRVSHPTRRLIEEYGDISLSWAEANYLDQMVRHGIDYELGAMLTDTGMVGAGIGGGFTNTNELHVLKYNQAMSSPDSVKWKEAVKDEYDKMIKYGVFEPVKRSDIPSNTMILTSTWAMKKKSSGKYRARLNARGFEQIDGIHYDEDSKSSPVVSEMTIKMILTLIAMGKWHGLIKDVVGAFLHGEFEKDRKMYMGVPQGFEEWYDPDVVLLLKKTLYGTKQAAARYYDKTCEALKKMNFTKSKADPCLFFKWVKYEDDYALIVWIIWVDDNLIAGPKTLVEDAAEQLERYFECDEGAELVEYVGCKLTRNVEAGWIKLTQPVLLQSFKDEFDIPEQKTRKTPALAGQVLRKGIDSDVVSSGEHKTYRTGVGKLIHMGKWSRPESCNAIRECSRFVSYPTPDHVQAMYRILQYMLDTPGRGWLLNPDTFWDGNRDFEFTISGKSDSDYAKDPDKFRSVSGWIVSLNDAPISVKSRMQQSVTLSVTEAEGVAATQCVQDMLFAMHVLESIGLNVKKPMILSVDNKAVVDLVHNWSVGGRTRHVSIRQSFLRELKGAGTLEVQWIPTNENSADLLTKNLSGPLFDRHASDLVGHDQYMTDE